MGEVVDFTPNKSIETEIEDADLVCVCLLDAELLPTKDEEQKVWFGVAGIWLEDDDVQIRLYAAFTDKGHAHRFAVQISDRPEKVKWMSDEMVDMINEMLDAAIGKMPQQISPEELERRVVSRVLEIVKKEKEDEDPEIH